jgi:hypothetical protein
MAQYNDIRNSVNKLKKLKRKPMKGKKIIVSSDVNKCVDDLINMTKFINRCTNVWTREMEKEKEPESGDYSLIIILGLLFGYWNMTQLFNPLMFLVELLITITLAYISLDTSGYKDIYSVDNLYKIDLIRDYMFDNNLTIKKLKLAQYYLLSNKFNKFNNLFPDFADLYDRTMINNNMSEWLTFNRYGYMTDDYIIDNLDYDYIILF